MKISNSFNSKLQFKDTQFIIENILEHLLMELKGFKLLMTSVLELMKQKWHGKTKYSPFYFSSKAETIINDSDINDVFESKYCIVISNTQSLLE